MRHLTWAEQFNRRLFCWLMKIYFTLLALATAILLMSVVIWP